MKWISVKDKLPENLKQCLVYLDIHSREMYIANYLSGDFIHGFYNNKLYNVTHWMPLPDPPKAINVED